MRLYEDQPSEDVPQIDLDDMKNWIEDCLKEDLPYCKVNEWFIESVHFANMLDNIAREIK